MGPSKIIKRIVPLHPTEGRGEPGWGPPGRTEDTSIRQNRMNRPSTVKVKRDNSFYDVPEKSKPEPPGSYYVKYRGKDLRLPISAKLQKK